jgi:hypothetical protein
MAYDASEWKRETLFSLDRLTERPAPARVSAQVVSHLEGFVKIRFIAMLAASALLASVTPAASQTVSVSGLPSGAEPASGLGHGQSVVSNQYGYFAAYNYDRNGSDTDTRWRLVRSVDGGATFSTLHESCSPLQASCPGTSTPVIETDRDGNIYLIYSNSDTGDAHFLRFLVSNGFTSPTSLTLPAGAAQKFTAVIDESRGRIYYAATHTKTTVWFFTIPLDGSSYSRVLLTQSGLHANAHYPTLYLDEHDHLYAAWTTLPNDPPDVYHSIHVMRSLDGGATWQKLDGTLLTLPVVADESGPTDEVTVIGERGVHAWLWTMIVKQGKAHFWYRENGSPVQKLHYVRFDTVSGDREPDTTPTWGEVTSLNAEHGDCSTRRGRLDGTIYCVSKIAGGDDRFAVARTTDNGHTWANWTESASVPGCTPNCYFWMSTARQVDENGGILGTFALLGQIKFFTVSVPTPTRFPRSITANAADPVYPFSNAGDDNPATLWIASPTVSPANNNAWIQMDLGTIKEVRQVRWTGYSPIYSPTHYTLSASIDGINWTTVRTRASGAGIVDGLEPVYLNVQYLRLTTTKVGDGDGGSLVLREFWAEGGGPVGTPLPQAGDISTEVPLLNGVHYYGVYAFDGNPLTMWLASPPGAPGFNTAWILLDLQVPRPITRLKWIGAKWHSGAHSPANYSIWVSKENAWLLLKSRTNATGVVMGDEAVAVTARYVFLNVTKVHDGTGWPLGLWEFWAEH